MKLTQAAAKVFAVPTNPAKSTRAMTAIRGANGSMGLYLCWGDCPR